MWKDAEKAPIWEFLGWVLLISIITNAIAFFLEPYSILFAQENLLTAGYVFYAINGILFSSQPPAL